MCYRYALCDASTRGTLQMMRSASSSSRDSVIAAAAGLDRAGDIATATPKAPPPKTLSANWRRDVDSAHVATVTGDKWQAKREKW